MDKAWRDCLEANGRPVSGELDFHRTDKAMELAKWVHAGQTRKDGKTPYLNHPIKVALTLQGYLRSIDVCVALLHDSLEDLLVGRESLRCEEKVALKKRLVSGMRDLGMDILEGVWWMTSPDKDGSSLHLLNREERKFLQRAKLAAAPATVKLIKLADRLDNLTDEASKTDPSFARDGKYWQESQALFLTLIEGNNPGTRDFYLNYPWVKELQDLLFFPPVLETLVQEAK